MTRPDTRKGLAAAALITLLGAASCSLMYEYDLEGKPCGNNDTCLPGFVCSKTEGCIRPDAGGDAGRPRDAAMAPDAEEPTDAELDSDV